MSNGSPPLDRKAVFYMALLALQAGIQPVLTTRFTPPGITRSSVAMTQEALKFGIAFVMLHLSGKYQIALKDWSVRAWLWVAVFPAALYAVQNIAALTAYQNLDPLTYNVLNQTKTLSAALCCYLLMGWRQSRIQIAALFLLLLSALIMEGMIKVNWITWGEKSESKDAKSLRLWETKHFTHGVAPILLASFISGLAGAISQMNLQSVGGGRDPYLFSMELCSATALIIASSLLVSPDGEHVVRHGFWNGWTYHTFIPIMSNSIGGIVVGLVTKHAGSVRKGFALIFSILLSGILQAAIQPDHGVSREQLVGGVLAAFSLFLHTKFPPSARRKQE